MRNMNEIITPDRSWRGLTKIASGTMCVNMIPLENMRMYDEGGREEGSMSGTRKREGWAGRRR